MLGCKNAVQLCFTSAVEYLFRLPTPMTREYTKPVVVPCTHCGASNVFNQPYAYHAGFGDQGFLYSESGTCTLVWNSHSIGL